LGRNNIEINFENASIEEIEVAMNCTPMMNSALRLRAMYGLYKGLDRESVLIFCNINEKTLRNWIHLFNDSGIDGLIDKPRSGRPRRISLEDVQKEIIPLVENPSKADVTHWTGKKLHGYLSETMQKEVAYSTLIRYLHEQDFNLRFPRKWPEKQDEKLRSQFVEEMKILQNQKDTNIWFCDESGIEGDPRPRRRWVKKGEKRTVPYAGTHIRSNLIGAVCPQNGEFFSLIMSHCDTVSFQCYLDHLAETTQSMSEKNNILVLDNASWHKSKTLNWHHFTPKYLPPYSPDLNPIERLWGRMKADFFADYIAKTKEQLWERIGEAVTFYLKNPQQVSSTCSFRK
jgi:transposase